MIMKQSVVFTPYIRNIVLALPLYVLSIVPFILLGQQLDISVDGGYVLLGALGWWLALIARIPVILFVKSRKMSNKTA